MSSHTLKTYLANRPTTVPSAAELARLHGVDTKTATRILRANNYVPPQSWGEGWTYSPTQPTTLDPSQLLVLALSNNYLLSIPSLAELKKFVRLEPYSTDEPFPLDSKEHATNTLLELLELDSYNALRMVVLGLTSLINDGILPFRAELSARGIYPLVSQSNTTPKAD